MKSESRTRAQLPEELALTGEQVAELLKPRHENADKSSTAGSVHVLVYHIDEQGYGLFLSDVDRIVRVVAITPLSNVPETIMGIINVQGTIVPVVNMRAKLRQPDRAMDMADQFVIARTARRLVALVVDSVQGVVERSATEIVKIGEVVPGLEDLKGVIKLPDGLILIHDLERFLFPEEEEGMLNDELSDD